MNRFGDSRHHPSVGRGHPSPRPSPGALGAARFWWAVLRGLGSCALVELRPSGTVGKRVRRGLSGPVARTHREDLSRGDLACPSALFPAVPQANRSGRNAPEQRPRAAPASGWAPGTGQEAGNRPFHQLEILPRGHVPLPDSRVRRGGTALRPEPGAVRRPAGCRYRADGGDCVRHSRGGDGLPPARVLGARRICRCGGGSALRDQPWGWDGTHRPFLPDWSNLFRRCRLVRDAGRYRRQRPHRERRPNLHRAGARDRLRRRLGDGHVRSGAGRTRPLRVVPVLHGSLRGDCRSASGPGASDPLGFQPGGLVDRPLRPGRGRHLHQVRRCGGGSGGQGRSGDP